MSFIEDVTPEDGKYDFGPLEKSYAKFVDSLEQKQPIIDGILLTPRTPENWRQRNEKAQTLIVEAYKEAMYIIRSPDAETVFALLRGAPQQNEDSPGYVDPWKVPQKIWKDEWEKTWKARVEDKLRTLHEMVREIFAVEEEEFVERMYMAIFSSYVLEAWTLREKLEGM